MTRHGKLAVIALVVAGSSGTARADETDACLAAPVDGQQLQRAGKLLQARERFAVCANRTCPAEIVSDCVKWTQDVTDALPTVVLTARDSAGQDLGDVTIGIDGQAPVALSPRTIELDPGSHRLLFARPGMPDIVRQVILSEGVKNRRIVVVFEAPEARAAPPKPPVPTVVERPVPLGAWMLAGVGALGLASFATFAILGDLKRNADHCDTGCPIPDKNTVDTELRIADVSLGVGIVGLGIAAYLYLSRPTVERPASAFVDVRPTRGGGTGVIGLRF
jgi:hypothetical protein